jgi:hypothetical protein
LVVSGGILHANQRIFSRMDEFVRKADAIALVEVGANDLEPNRFPAPIRSPEELRDYARSYQTMTRAAVKQSLKGDLPKTIDVFHAKELDDHLFQQGAGLYLVFLKRTAAGLVPFEGWPSSKPIKNNMVLGWERHPYYGPDFGAPLGQVLEKISLRLKNPTDPKTAIVTAQDAQEDSLARYYTDMLKDLPRSVPVSPGNASQPWKSSVLHGSSE